MRSETHNKRKDLREKRMFEYRLQSAHTLTSAHCGVRIEYCHGSWNLADLAMSQDWGVVCTVIIVT